MLYRVKCRLTALGIIARAIPTARIMSMSPDIPFIISIPDALGPGVEAVRESAFVADHVGAESTGKSAPGVARVGAQAGIS